MIYTYRFMLGKRKTDLGYQGDDTGDNISDKILITVN